VTAASRTIALVELFSSHIANASVCSRTRQVSWIDFDNDGRVDLFGAGYGRNFLYHNEGGGRRTARSTSKSRT